MVERQKCISVPISHPSTGRQNSETASFTWLRDYGRKEVQTGRSEQGECVT